MALLSSLLFLEHELCPMSGKKDIYQTTGSQQYFTPEIDGQILWFLMLPLLLSKKVTTYPNKTQGVNSCLLDMVFSGSLPEHRCTHCLLTFFIPLRCTFVQEVSLTEQGLIFLSERIEITK